MNISSLLRWNAAAALPATVALVAFAPLASLSLVGCGKSAGGEETAQAEGGAGGGSTDFVPATDAEIEALCEDGCAEAPPDGMDNCNTVAECQDKCTREMSGLDMQCASCLTSNIGFDAGGCNEWECRCSQSYIPGYGLLACETECAASLQQARDEYADATRPENLGRAPEKIVEVVGMSSIEAMTVDETGKVWIAGIASAVGGDPITVALLDANLELLWHWTDPRSQDGRDRRTVYMTRSQGKTFVTGVDGWTFIFGAEGFESEVGASVEGSLGGLKAFGDALLVKVGSATSSVEVLDLSGAAIWSAPKSLIEGVSHSWAHAVGPNGDWTFVSAVDDGAIMWRRLSPTPANRPEAASVDWTQTLKVDSRSSVSLMVLGADGATGGDTLAWGLRFAGGSSALPWMARLTPAGTALWQWGDEDGDVPGQIMDATLTDGGVTCLAARESWNFRAEATGDPEPHCSPDGCQGLTARCLGADGAELWQYNHRSESSDGNAVAIDGQGRVLVAGTIYRDPLLSTGANGVVMAFQP